MPTTTYVNFTAGVRALSARTNSGGGAVNDISAEEDRLAQGLITAGYLTDGAFEVNADSGMDLAVGSGAIKEDLYAVEGTVAGQGLMLVRLDQSSPTVTIPAADPAQARTDEVYLVVSDANYDGGSLTLPRIGLRKGDPGSGSPGPDSGWTAYALLASVAVGAAVTEISSGSITDARSSAGLNPVLSNALVPAGATMGWAGSVAPSGWLLADGAAVSRTTFARLFAAIGTTYGAGDGSTTFNLPNLKGRIPVGVDSAQSEFNALGETGGAKTHTLTTNEMPSHNHGGATGGQSASHTHAGSTDAQGNHQHFTSIGTARQVAAGGAGFVIDDVFHSEPSSFAGNHAHNVSVGGASNDHSHSISSQGGGAAHNNLQPYLAMNYIIKA